MFECKDQRVGFLVEHVLLSAIALSVSRPQRVRTKQESAQTVDKNSHTQQNWTQACKWNNILTVRVDIQKVN